MNTGKMSVKEQRAFLIEERNITMINLVFWGPRSFQFDLEMNINIYCMHYIIREDNWRP
jgi:hypothetical protein